MTYKSTSEIVRALYDNGLAGRWLTAKQTDEGCVETEEEIDPVYALAFFQHESGFSTTGEARTTRARGKETSNG